VGEFNYTKTCLFGREQHVLGSIGPRATTLGLTIYDITLLK
jgi:hypothetical protein